MPPEDEQKVLRSIPVQKKWPEKAYSGTHRSGPFFGFSCTALIDISLTLEASDIPVADSLRYYEFLYWMVDHSLLIGCRHAATTSCQKEKQSVLRTMCERIYFLCIRAFILQLVHCTIHKNSNMRLGSASTAALVGLIRHLHSVVNKRSTHTFTRNMSVICEESLKALEPLWTEYLQRKDTYKPFLVEKEPAKPSEEVRKQIKESENAVPGEPVDEKSANYRFAYGMMVGIEASVRLDDGMKLYNQVLRGMSAFREELQTILHAKNVELPDIRTDVSDHSELSLDLIDLALSTITLCYTLPEEGSLFSPKHIMGTGADIWFEDLAPALFAKVRRMCKVESKDYLKSVAKREFSFIEFQTNSKSGEIFFFSHDGRFLLKTISTPEATKLLRMLPAYISHVELGASFLMRICGLYRFSSGGVHRREVRHVLVAISVMDCRQLGLHHQFDLKGSTAGRAAGDDHKVKKDLDWINSEWMMELPTAHKRRIAEIHQADAEFLVKQQVLDYSVLVGVHDRKSTEAGVHCRSVKLLASIISNKVMPMIRKARLLKQASGGEQEHVDTMTSAARRHSEDGTTAAASLLASNLLQNRSGSVFSNQESDCESSVHLKGPPAVAAAGLASVPKTHSLSSSADGATPTAASRRTSHVSDAESSGRSGAGIWDRGEGSFGSSASKGAKAKGKLVNLDEELLRIKALKAAGTKRQEAREGGRNGSAAGQEARATKTEVLSARPGISSCPWDGPHGPIFASAEEGIGPRGRYVYLIGIIDFLTPWQNRKRAEYAMNWAMGRGFAGSCAPPNMYAQRQTNFFVSKVLGMHHLQSALTDVPRPLKYVADSGREGVNRLGSLSIRADSQPMARPSNTMEPQSGFVQSLPNVLRDHQGAKAAGEQGRLVQGASAPSDSGTPARPGTAKVNTVPERSPSAPGLLEGALGPQAAALPTLVSESEGAELDAAAAGLARIPAIPKEAEQAGSGAEVGATWEVFEEGAEVALSAEAVEEEVRAVAAAEEAAVRPNEGTPGSGEEADAGEGVGKVGQYGWGREVVVQDSDDKEAAARGGEGEALVLSQMHTAPRRSRGLLAQMEVVSTALSGGGAGGALLSGPAQVQGPSHQDTPRTSSPVAGASPNCRTRSSSGQGGGGEGFTSYFPLAPPPIDRLFDRPPSGARGGAQSDGATFV